jgi:hypothetical protein
MKNKSNNKMALVLAMFMMFIVSVFGTGMVLGENGNGIDADDIDTNNNISDSNSNLGSDASDDLDSNVEDDSDIEDESDVEDETEESDDDSESEDELTDDLNITIEGTTVELDDFDDNVVGSTANVTTADGKIIPGKVMSACVLALKTKFPRISNAVSDERLKDKCKALISDAIARKKTMLQNRFEARKEAKFEMEDESENKDRLEARNEKIIELRKKVLENIKEENKAKFEIAMKNEKFREKLSNLNEKDFEKISTLDRARLKEVLESKNATLALQKFNVKKVKVEDYLEQRKISKDKLEKAKENFKEAQERYDDLKEKFSKVKDNFTDSAKKIKECKSDNSTVCAELETKANENAKKYLLHTAEIILKSLEKVKAKLEESENLNQSFVAEKIADIDSAITKVNDLVEKGESAQTKEEIKAVAKDIAKLWTTLKIKVNENSVHMYSSQVENIIKRSEILETKLDKILAQMNGTNITSVEAELDVFSDKINLAREKFELGEKLLFEARDMDKNNSTDVKFAVENVRSAHKYFEEAKRLISEAQDSFKKIVREIRNNGGNLEIEMNEEIEVVEESA